jgi:hypothetical protein
MPKRENSGKNQESNARFKSGPQDDRAKEAQRERNLGHKDAEEHSRRAKGQQDKR